MSTKNNKKMFSFGVAERLKSARKEAGLTQQEAADRGNVTVQSWRNYEAGRAEPKISTLLFLAEKNISLSWLASGKGSKIIREVSKDEERVFRGSLVEWIREESKNDPNFYADFTAECAVSFSRFTAWLKKRKAGPTENR